MSHSSHRKAVRDSTRPLAQRASHARSCARHVGNRLGIDHFDLIGWIAKVTGADLLAPADEHALMLAFEFLENIDTLESISPLPGMYRPV